MSTHVDTTHPNVDPSAISCNVCEHTKHGALDVCLLASSAYGNNEVCDVSSRLLCPNDAIEGLCYA